MKLVNLDEYMRIRFTPTSCPSKRTLRSWIQKGHLAGFKKGGCYYINLDAEKQLTGNPLVDRVLLGK